MGFLVCASWSGPWGQGQTDLLGPSFPFPKPAVSTFSSRWASSRGRGHKSPQWPGLDTAKVPSEPAQAVVGPAARGAGGAACGVPGAASSRGHRRGALDIAMLHEVLEIHLHGGLCKCSSLLCCWRSFNVCTSLRWLPHPPGWTLGHLQCGVSPVKPPWTSFYQSSGDPCTRFSWARGPEGNCGMSLDPAGSVGELSGHSRRRRPQSSILCWA